MLFCLFPALCNGQGWERTYSSGEGNYDFTFAITRTSDGGFAMTGSSSNEPDDSGVFILRIDPEGNQQWLSIIETDSSAISFDIEETSDHGFMIIGNISHEDSRTDFAAKVNDCGTFQWIKTISEAWDVYPNAISMARSQNNEYIIIGPGNSGSTYEFKATKIDEAGNIIWTKYYNDLFLPEEYLAWTVISTLDQNYMICGNQLENAAFLLKINPDGDPIWHNTYEGIGAWDVVQVSEDEYVISGSTQVMKVDGNGNEIWRSLFAGLDDIPTTSYIESADEGGFVVANNDITGEYFKIRLIKLNDSGDIEWNRTYGSPGFHTSHYGDIAKASDGGYVLGGVKSDSIVNLYILKVTNRGDLYTNRVKGRIAVDLNLNCIVEEPEPEVFSGWLVEFVGEQTFYTTADENGRYEIELDTGTYQINLYHPANIWQNCDLPPLTLNNFHQTTILDLPVQNIEPCAWLEVDISTPRIRRCWNNHYTVSYCNNGLNLVQDVYIEVLLDSYLSYNYASIVPMIVEEQLLTFDIGTLAPGECGSFEIVAYLPCAGAQFGQTHCTEAHIYPDTFCEIWDGPNIEVAGICENDTVFFNITNVGDDMATERNYQVIKNSQIILQMPYQLTTQEVLEVAVPVENHATYRLEAEQVDEFPAYLGNPQASASVEGCDGIATTGFVTIFPEDDGESYLEIDCRENIGSYDPNDKLAFPAGVSEEHLIRPGTALEYQIRFQNTGTDTAFTVVIRDTLSAKLDITSFRPGTSSHSYDYEIYGNGILKFTFNDILLPDSNINEVASHGFVKFKIRPKASLEPGSTVKNQAGIYFDFNAPVITNTTWHTIEEDFIEVLTTTTDFDYSPLVQIAPNPVSKRAFVEIAGYSLNGEKFSLYTITGQLKYQQKLIHNQVDFSKVDLAPGLYYFRIESTDKLIGSGKIIIH